MSNNLALVQVSPTQSSKEATINQALGQLDAALTDCLAISLSGGTYSLALSDYQQHVGYVLTSAPSDHTVFNVPMQKKLSIFVNNSSHSVDLVYGTTTITIGETSANLIYTDGTANGMALAIGPQGPKPLQAVAPWATSTSYTSVAPASFVFENGNAYECLTSHISGSFASDLTAGYWGIIANGGITPFVLPVAAWVTATAYVAGPPASVVTDAGSSYVCLTAHTSGTFATDLGAGKWLLLAEAGTNGTNGSPGATTLAGCTDVTITSASDKQFLRYDTASSKWVNFSFGNVNTQTANYTLVLADDQGYVRMNVSSANTLTVPPNSSVAFPIGSLIEISQVGTGTTTITAGAGVTINDVTALGLAMGTQYEFGALRKVATNTWDWSEGATGAGGVTTLAADTDVLLTSPTNGDVLTWNGTKWVNLPSSGGGGAGGSGELAWNNPVYTAFTGVNDTGAGTVVANTTWGVTIVANSGGNVNSFIGLEQTIPNFATHKWQATARLRSLTPVMQSYYMCPAMFIRDSTGGNIQAFGASGFQNGLAHYDFNGPTTLASYGNLTGTGATMPPEFWMRLHYDGTNLNLQISTNGTTFLNVYQTTLTAFLAAAPDKVGFGMDPNNNNENSSFVDVGLECMYWLLEDLGP